MLPYTYAASQETMFAAVKAMALAQEQSSKSNNEMVAKMTTINRNIEVLIDQTKQTNDSIKNEGRMNRIQSAFLHCSVGAFEYREGGSSYSGKISKSTELLAQRILNSFFHFLVLVPRRIQPLVELDISKDLACLNEDRCANSDSSTLNVLYFSVVTLKICRSRPPISTSQHGKLSRKSFPPPNDTGTE